MSRTIALVPNANLLMESLRSVGYGIEMAIADIIDNSIAAHASEVRLITEWREELSRIIVVDNGNGMSKDELISAMKIGSADPTEDRESDDLGRFGMGMKTASFSMGRCLSVVTKCEDSITSACWDLDYIATEADGQWSLIIEDSIDTEILSLFDSYDSCTVVIIEKLDRVLSQASSPDKRKDSFLRMILNIENHLSLVFHRFIESKEISIHISLHLSEKGEAISPWNPFVVHNNATQELSEEVYWDGGKHVAIQPFVLPHKTKFQSKTEYDSAGGIQGWQRHQGFYLYRNKRLIVYGTWFRIFRREPAYNLARIQIDIDSSSDFDWKIDIKKSSAIPPHYIKEVLEKAAVVCSERSALVYNSRGTYTKSTASQNLDYVWEQRRSKEGKYSFFINKKHPLLRQLNQTLQSEDKVRLSSYLSLIENYAPFMQSGVVDHLTDTTSGSVANADGAEMLSLLNDVKGFIHAFSGAGYSKDEIRQTLLGMPNLRTIKREIEALLEQEETQ